MIRAGVRGGDLRSARRRSQGPWDGFHFRRNSPPSATPVVAQNRNIHRNRSVFSSASFASSFASKRAKLSSFSSRRSERYVASTALNQSTSSLVTSSPNVSENLRESLAVTGTTGSGE